MKQYPKKSTPVLEDAGFLQRDESAILVDGFEGPATQLEADILVKLGNPDALDLKIWGNRALHHFGDVTPDTPFFLGQTRPVDSAAGADTGASDTTNTCHDFRKVAGVAGRAGWLPQLRRQAESTRILEKNSQLVAAQAVDPALDIRENFLFLSVIHQEVVGVRVVPVGL